MGAERAGRKGIEQSRSQSARSELYVDRPRDGERDRNRSPKQCCSGQANFSTANASMMGPEHGLFRFVPMTTGSLVKWAEHLFRYMFRTQSARAHRARWNCGI